MIKGFTFGLLCITLVIFLPGKLLAQEDSFFLAKKKGLLGKLGRSISTDIQPAPPEKTANVFRRFNGKVIRSIEISPLSFTRNLYDTADKKNTLAVRIAKKFHRNSSDHLIRKNLFFHEGEKLSALLLADNERYLRELPFLQNAFFTVFNPADARDSVDIVIITKDVFSIGGDINISSTSRLDVELREENLAGEGNRIAGSVLYDKDRNPRLGLGGSFIKRNIKGSLVNLTTSLNTYRDAFNSGRREETEFLVSFDRPLVSRYMRWTGGAELSLGNTFNAYLADSLYRSDFQYSLLSADLWGGYNVGSRRRMKDDSENRLRHFIAARALYNHFYKVPDIYKDNYNYNYADIEGILGSYSLYKQNFYRTNFIYGFGRYEDVPEGLNATITAGYTDKQGVGRTYYGLDFTATNFDKKGGFTAYNIITGGFVRSNRSEDLDLLLGVDHFTRLRNLGTFWRNRNFINISYARQMRTTLNQPLFLSSEFGLPYYRNGLQEADTRTSLKMESVFYNLKKFLGFRFAPFVFTDFTLMNPIVDLPNQQKLFSGLGGGFRTRNENLVFGTIEVKGYYFPKITDQMELEGMKSWRIEFNTNLKFKYNSSFIRKPAFILVN